MIRINLLPQKRAARGASAAGGQPSQAWLLVILGLMALEAVALFLFHRSKQSELEEQRATNQRIEAEVQKIRDSISDHEQIKKALATLKARDEAIAKLEKARSGPTAVLLELGQLVTPGRGPSMDAEALVQASRDNPLAVYNAGWDARRLWLTSYVENQRVVRLEGQARDAGDVYELAQRLRLSPYFYDVQLLPGKKETDREAQAGVTNFALQMRVRY